MIRMLVVMGLFATSAPSASFASFASSAPAQGTPPTAPPASRPLSIEDYYRVRTVGSPQLSPDGAWVAFTLSRRIEATNGDSSAVWLVPADGSAPPRQVSAQGQDAESPRWLEKGWLRYVSDGEEWDLEAARPEATRVRRGRSPPRARADLPSADGKWIARLRDLPPPRPPAPDRSEFERRHESRFKGVQFDWLEFQRDGAPFPAPNPADPLGNPPQEVFRAGDGAEKQLTTLGLRPQGLQWDAEGTRLVYTADSTYRDERRYNNSQIWTVTRDGAVRRISTDPEMNYTGASFSPDGRWILYTRQLSTDAVIARRLDHGGATDLAVIPAEGR